MRQESVSIKRRLFGLSSSNVLGDRKNDLACFLGDHIDGGDDEKARDIGKNRSIDHAEVRGATDSKLVI